MSCLMIQASIANPLLTLHAAPPQGRGMDFSPIVIAAAVVNSSSNRKVVMRQVHNES